jgi:hypothetical protein
MMDLEKFLSQSSNSPSTVFNCCHRNQEFLEEVHDLARRGLKLFPVSLAAKLNGCPDRLIADATDNVSVLDELSAAAQPLWGYRLAIGPSGVCIMILNGAIGRASFAALVPDLDEVLTLQARCGDKAYAFFRQPSGLKRIAFQRKLARGVSLLGDGESCIVPPFGGAAWVNAGAEIEALPYVLCELLAAENPDSPPGRAIPAPKAPARQVPCRPTTPVEKPRRDMREGFPTCNQGGWQGGYRIHRQR